MAIVLDEILVKLGFVADVNAAERFSGRITSIISRASYLSTVLGGVLTGAVLNSVVDTASQFEKFETQLTTIEGSAERAKKSLEWIADFGARTPYDVAQVTDAFVKLKSYGLDPIENDLLESLGNTASAMGKSLEQAVEAIADAVRGENERLKEFGIVGSKNGNKMTYTYDYDGQSYTKEVENTAQEIQGALQEIFDQKFDGGMIALSKTWEGMLSNMGDQWTAFKLNVSEKGIFDNLKSNLRSVLDYLEEHQEFINTTAFVIGKAINTVVTAVSLLLLPLVTLFKMLVFIHDIFYKIIKTINDNALLKFIAILTMIVTSINLFTTALATLNTYMAVAIVRVRLFASTLALANTGLITFARTAVTSAAASTIAFINFTRSLTLAKIATFALASTANAYLILSNAISALTARTVALNASMGITRTISNLVRLSIIALQFSFNTLKLATIQAIVYLRTMSFTTASLNGYLVLLRTTTLALIARFKEFALAIPAVNAALALMKGQITALTASFNAFIASNAYAQIALLKLNLIFTALSARIGVAIASFRAFWISSNLVQISIARLNFILVMFNAKVAAAIASLRGLTLASITSQLTLANLSAALLLARMHVVYLIASMKAFVLANTYVQLALIKVNTLFIALSARVGIATASLRGFSLASLASRLSIARLSTALVAFRTAAMTALAPVMLIVTAVTVLAFVIKDLYDYFSGNDSIVGKLAEGSPELVSILDSIGSVIDEFKKLFNDVFDGGSLLSEVLAPLQALIGVIAELLKFIMPIISALLKVLVPVLRVVLGIIAIAVKAVSLLLIGLIKLASFVIGVMTGAFTLLAKTIEFVFGGIFGVIKDVFGGVIGFIVDRIMNVVNFITGIANFISSLLSGDFKGVIESVSSVNNESAPEASAPSYDGRESIRSRGVPSNNSSKVESTVNQQITVNSAEEASLIASRTAQATRQNNWGFL